MKGTLLYVSVVGIGILFWTILLCHIGLASIDSIVIPVKVGQKDIVLGKNLQNQTLPLCPPHTIDTILNQQSLLIETKENKANPSSKNQKNVNINSANKNSLISLPGIGPVLAVRIIDFREKNGKFKNVSDLMKVKGIGKGKLQKINTLICF